MVGRAVTTLRIKVTLAVVAMTLVTATASSETSSAPSGLIRHLLKGTYVLYSNGRRSERDMPLCSSEAEACNLAHRRYWFTPITERLCRCKDQSCPMHFTNLEDPLSQHVSNRAQLKFCGPVRETLPQCQEGEEALRMQYIKRQSQSPYYASSTRPNSGDTHTTLLCRCPWPYAWSLDNTTNPSPREQISHYTCQKLPQCSSGNQCGYIREDTLETYYMCSCPQQHLCIFRGPQPTVVTSQLHFHGNAYVGHCTPR